MAKLPASLDPLRYGLRALEEMAREQASVPAPAATRVHHFAPHPTLRAARDGSLLTLRLFTEAEDDATALVFGDAKKQRFSPIPARGASLFEAYAAAMAAEDDPAITIGFPLVTFVQQGSTRAAPLFSRGGARARWTIGDAPWVLSPNARDGAKLPIPDGLLLELADAGPHALHAGVWHFLFGLDGAALGSIADAGKSGIGALVRAATRALSAGAEGEEPEPVSNDPLTREDLAALASAALRRAPPSRALRCHLHGLAMLPPRGDPTSSLRADLSAILDVPLPPRGPLAVYLGARAAAPSPATIFTHGKLPPTPSQLEAARAFEGTQDLVAVRGPPGCGKTALLHHIAAEAVVACALGKLWTAAPPRGRSWPLVVTSTNNTAVDQALSPFLHPPERHGLPIGLRLGNRRTLAETTAAVLTTAIEALEKPGAMSLDEARSAFESRAASVREFLRKKERAETKKDDRVYELERRIATLREEIIGAGDLPPPAVALTDLSAAMAALREHAQAAERLPALHLKGRKGSVDRACEKWSRANELRLPRIAPVLAALGLDVPFGDLDPKEPQEDIERQHDAIDAVLAALATARLALLAPNARKELRALTERLAQLSANQPELSLDPELYPAALAVRDAWARAHRTTLLPRLIMAREAARSEPGSRRMPLPLALRDLAVLFPVVGCTLLAMRASFPLDRDVIDRLVIDEAAQCAPIYAVPALARARRAMITGDTAQLAPVYTLDPRVDDRVAKGLSEEAIAPFRMNNASTSSAQAAVEPRVRAQLSLSEHFRSQPEIVALASRWSGYTLDVRTPRSSLVELSPLLDAPVVTRVVRGLGARTADGVVNESEAASAIDLVTRLVADGVSPADIAVLSPFVGQSLRLERELEARGLALKGGVLVSTVHRLQGGERRVVVFSLTATERRHLRWIAERPHLLHVATSRAQDHLVLLFDPTAVTREPALAPLHELAGAFSGGAGCARAGPEECPDG
jgi:hypothetical protein